MTEMNHQDTNDTKRRLPDGWRWARLGEAIRQAQLGFACGERDPNGTVQLRMNNVTDRGGFDWSTITRVPAESETIQMYRLQLGDVLFNNTNSTDLVGKTAIFEGFDEPVVFSNHFTRLRTSDDLLSPSFLALWLRKQWQNRLFANICNRWIGQSAVQRDKLLALEIPLPPLPEQQRIAAILNEQMAAVERARAAAQAQLDDAKNLAAAYLQAVFADADAKSWPKHRFDQVAVLQRGYDLPFQDRVPGPYPVMTSGGQAGSHAEFKAKGPGVVTGRSGSVGRVHFVKEDYWPHNTALFVRDFLGNEPRYVFYLLQWINVRQVSSGTGVPTLDRKQVHKLIVPHPSVLDQKRTAAVLNIQIAAVEKLRAALEAQLAEINALPAALLRRAFSGEL